MTDDNSNESLEQLEEDITEYIGKDEDSKGPVSYTHLTLPTIYSV